MYFVFSFILLNALFLEEFTPLAKFYTAAGSEGMDKSHLWLQPATQIHFCSTFAAKNRKTSEL